MFVTALLSSHFSHFRFWSIFSVSDVVCAGFINYTRAHFANDLQINKHLRFYYCPPACVCAVCVVCGAVCVLLLSLNLSLSLSVSVSSWKSLPCGAGNKSEEGGFHLKYHLLHTITIYTYECAPLVHKKYFGIRSDLCVLISRQ